MKKFIRGFAVSSIAIALISGGTAILMTWMKGPSADQFQMIIVLSTLTMLAGVGGGIMKFLSDN